MANQDITEKNKITIDGQIESGKGETIKPALRADIMRKLMETKNTLQHPGDIYVGTGNKEIIDLGDGNTCEIYETTCLTPTKTVGSCGTPFLISRKGSSSASDTVIEYEYFSKELLGNEVREFPQIIAGGVMADPNNKDIIHLGYQGSPSTSSYNLYLVPAPAEPAQFKNYVLCDSSHGKTDTINDMAGMRCSSIECARINVDTLNEADGEAPDVTFECLEDLVHNYPQLSARAWVDSGAYTSTPNMSIVAGWSGNSLRSPLVGYKITKNNWTAGKCTIQYESGWKGFDRDLEYSSSLLLIPTWDGSTTKIYVISSDVKNRVRAPKTLSHTGKSGIEIQFDNNNFYISPIIFSGETRGKYFSEVVTTANCNNTWRNVANFTDNYDKCTNASTLILGVAIKQVNATTHSEIHFELDSLSADSHNVLWGTVANVNEAMGISDAISVGVKFDTDDDGDVCVWVKAMAASEVNINYVGVK